MLLRRSRQGSNIDIGREHIDGFRMSNTHRDIQTHNVAMASTCAQFFVSLSIDGRISSQGQLSHVLSMNEDLTLDTAEDAEIIAKAEEEIDDPKPELKASKGDGKLTVTEDIQVGHVNWKALKLFFAGLGGHYPLLFWTFFLAGMCLTDLLNTLQTWWLGYWTHQYDVQDPSKVSVPL